MILDESGSMYSIQNDIVGSVNKFINDQQKKVDDTVFSLITFSTEFQNVYDKKLLSDVEEITSDNYSPNGMTALYDTIGFTLDKHKDKAACVVIVTDGEENSSKEHTLRSVQELIDKKKKDGWKFIFLSSDIGASKQGIGLGIRSTPTGVKTSTNNLVAGFCDLGNYVETQCNAQVMNYRCTGTMEGMGN
jgi:hypothetical protein